MEMVEEICRHCKHCLSCLCGDEFKDCRLKKSPRERAFEFSKMLMSHGESEDSYTSAGAGYEKGATEQKVIDIEKACEWLEMHIEYWLYDDGFLDVPAMLKDFRKAMEE